MSENLPPKRLVMDSLLAEKPSVYVTFDARHEGVIVPPHFRNNPQLVLQYGRQMAVPIVDLKVDERGITATLSFNRSPFLTFIPWDAVYAIAGADRFGMQWPEDVPKDLTAPAPPVPVKTPLRAVSSQKDSPPSPEDENTGPRLVSPSAADAGQSGDRALESLDKPVVTPPSDEDPEPRNPKGKRERPSFLRVVK